MFRLISRRAEDALTERILLDKFIRQHLAPYYSNIGSRTMTWTSNTATTIYVPTVSRIWVRGMLGRSNR